VSVRSLDRIFNPRRIAVFGVTINPNSVGGKVLTNLVGGGFRGVVYPVNPASEAVLGISCYANAKSLPRTPDLALICTPAADVPAIVRECGDAGIAGIVILSAGFRETGEAGSRLEEEIRAAQREFPGMRIIGPNCLGVLVPGLHLNASFAADMPQAGHVAFISQSGALCTSVLDWAREARIGFSHFVSIGNTIDVDFGDLIDYFGEDENTKSILLYIESISDARKFMTAARAFARTKPIVVYKAGRFPASARVAASHTGALAADDDVYAAAFRRAGLARVLDIGEIFDCAELVGRNKIPRGPRLGIVTNAGGPGVMATDALVASRGVLAELSEECLARLGESLPPHWSHGNPVDVLGDARSKRIEKATRIVLEDPGVDAVLVILTPQAMTNPTGVAQAVSQLSETTAKPVLTAWMGGERMHEGIRLLKQAGVPTYATPERAVRAFMTLVDYARNLERLYETPRDIRVELPLDRRGVRAQVEAALADGRRVLTEGPSKELLAAYGIPVAKPQPAASADQAVEIANEVGYPVVLKILSEDISHKTDVGGVALDVRNGERVREVFARMTAAAAAQRPDARIAGVTVQPMIAKKDGLELIVGAKRDPVFGSVVLVGAGGTTAEILADTSLDLPPLNERLALQMLQSLKIWPLLAGYRGSAAVDVDRLLEVLIRLSYLVADLPELRELDVNPLLVSPSQAIALDARVVVEPDSAAGALRPYAHLALRPYPEEYVRSVELAGGVSLTLRPIKPEDEPLWMELLGRCSRESIYSRFRYFFKWASHQAAIRYCFNDYDREIAIVAHLEENGRPRLLGVGRLVADANVETAEYAVLIVDDWQGRGLGSLLTDYCLEIARGWGLRRVVAITTTDNPRMISVFRRRGFEVDIQPEDGLVNVEKVLT
jgi:acetyltransferase